MNRKAQIKHIAIIMDGNGRWAKSRGFLRYMGHRKGKESVREAIKTARRLGIPYLTLYAFSNENWMRPEDEVNELMSLFGQALADETEGLMRNGVRLNVIGDLQRLPKKLQKDIAAAVKDTADNKDLTLTLAISYSAKQEICETAKKIAEKVRAGGLAAEQISEEYFQNELFTGGMPQVDLLIRTGGEVRISNFLLWQIAYAELYFTQTLWPDFTGHDLEMAVVWWKGRNRRFGRTQEQIDKDKTSINSDETL